MVSDYTILYMKAKRIQIITRMAFSKPKNTRMTKQVTRNHSKNDFRQVDQLFSPNNVFSFAEID